LPLPPSLVATAPFYLTPRPAESDPATFSSDLTHLVSAQRDLALFQKDNFVRMDHPGTASCAAWSAGITAGVLVCQPATNVGYVLIGAGMLILAGDGRGFPFDYDELERWTRVGYERGMRSRKGER
jgi:hypothetical protein